jgi:hypothetical protein
MGTLRNLKSHNYQLLWTLGGVYFEDIDGFMAVIRSDLNNPNRQVVVGDAYGYNYKYAATVLMHLHSLNFRMIKLISIWHNLLVTNYQREGMYKTEFMKRFPSVKARKYP